MFKVKISDEGTVRILDLSGRLLLGDPLTVIEKAVMATLTEGHKRIVFDFSHVDAIDSAVIVGVAVRLLSGGLRPEQFGDDGPQPHGHGSSLR